MKSSFDILNEIESMLKSNNDVTSIDKNANEFLDDIKSDERTKHIKKDAKPKKQTIADKRAEKRKDTNDEESIVDFAKSDKGDKPDDDLKNPQKIIREKVVKNVQYHIDNYNELRSAPTLNDYKDEIKEYFSRLSEDEKLIAYVVNKAIVEITLNEISAKKVLLPKSVSTQQKKESEVQSDEDQSADSKIKQQKQDDSPIVVGEGVKQNKSDFYLILANNK